MALGAAKRMLAAKEADPFLLSKSASEADVCEGGEESQASPSSTDESLGLEMWGGGIDCKLRNSLMVLAE
jgi:hypothetical protein